VSVLSARFPGANRATGREIVIDLVSATASLGLRWPAGIPRDDAGRYWIRPATHFAPEARSLLCSRSDPSNEQIAQVLGLWGGTTKVHHLLTNWRM
jgi:hypothetical protein